MTDTVQAALVSGTQQLRAAGIDGAARDARHLMAHALGVGRDRITLVLHDDLPAQSKTVFDQLIVARADHTPVSKLTGLRAFYGRDFLVTNDVLDPRPETEVLIDQALERPFDSLLDLGTGSGAIVVTLLAERPNSLATAVDISGAALDVAAQNAAFHGVGSRLTLSVSDWWANTGGSYDLIVSNPPYIAADEMAALAPEVRNHDPHIALTDGGDGLSCYRQVTAQAIKHLNVGGRLIVEIGPSQGVAVQHLFKQSGFARVGIRVDLDGRDRVVFGEKL